MHISERPTPPSLQARLIEFGGRACQAIRTLPPDPASKNISAQLARCATSPAANYAEAREAVSARDYIFKMKVCLKELRESHAWLGIARAAEIRGPEWAVLEAECNELIAIVVTCIKKARAHPR